MRYCYQAEKYSPDGQQLTAVLSAEWDTHRDACLAAKLRYNLTPDEFLDLKRDSVVKHRRVTITVNPVPVQIEGHHEKPAAAQADTGA